ncbi:MAG: hypothetical protein V1487_04080 [bacterium]
MIQLKDVFQEISRRSSEDGDVDSLAREIKADKLREATKLARIEGHKLIDSLRQPMTIADINYLFQSKIYWPALLENPSDLRASMLSDLYYAKPVEDVSIPSAAVKKIAKVMLDTELPTIAITANERIEAPINQKAIRKDVWREPNVNELAGLFDNLDQQAFHIAEYISPHALLIAAESDPHISRLLDQVPRDRSESVQAFILYQLAGNKNDWYPHTQIPSFVITPDGFNMHVVSRRGFYQYYTQN